ncbi:MAG TPA: 50S ribosomal protein L7ae-like protein [Eubacteriaceae bacterium]|nr:50S ribosomal protein L7ae-like protein [Eubacteriaceae bacterium]
MMKRIHSSKNKVVGIKQTRKAIKEGRAEVVYLAKDVDQHLFREIKKLCEDHHIEIYYAETMKELGKACSIDTKAATAAILSNQ